MPAPGQAIPAVTAHDVSLCGDHLALLEIADSAADAIDNADEFMSDHHRNRNRLLRPRVPVVYMYVRSADRSFLDADEDIVGLDFGYGNFFQPESGLGPAFYERLHGFAHGVENS